MADCVEIPHASLTPEALDGLIEEFVTREGTDYGHVEHSLEDKAASVRTRIERGEVVILFDPETETTTLTTRA